MPKRVVVIGNGFAGSQFTAAFNKLAGKHDAKITVISALNYSEITLGMTTAVAAPDEHSSLLYGPFKEPGVDLVVGVATKLEENTVTLADGTSIPFDVCVVCTGVAYPIFRPTVRCNIVQAPSTHLVFSLTKIPRRSEKLL